VTVHCDGFGTTDRSEIFGRVRRWLSADWEPTAAIAALPDRAELIERGGGRMLRGSSFYEDFVKTVLTINTNWSATCRMVAALVTEPGSGAFPGPETARGLWFWQPAACSMMGRSPPRATGPLSAWVTITCSASKGSAPMRRLIAEYCCMISTASLSTRLLPPICASGTAANRLRSPPTGHPGLIISRSATGSRGLMKSSAWDEGHRPRSRSTRSWRAVVVVLGGSVHLQARDVRQRRR